MDKKNPTIPPVGKEKLRRIARDLLNKEKSRVAIEKVYLILLEGKE